ncbi:MAG: energy transducer TonB, partial [Bacteroidota bacterium]
LSKKIKKSLASIINEFEPFEVVNKKPKEYTSLHRLKYLYRVVKKDGTFEGLQTITPQEDLYKGGEIEEVPIYANCNVKTDKKARECFQKSIFNHIRDNFRYPEKAQKQGIQGKVYIIFTIDKEGKVTNIRTRGPHPILEEEAQRIISLIPQMTTPARLNGKPVKIPFSIPITFKLP